MIGTSNQSVPKMAIDPMISYEMLWVYLCKPGGNKKHFSNHHFTIYRSEKADVTRCNQWIMIEITQSHVDLPNPLTENFCAFDMDPWEIPPLPCSQRHLRSWNGLAKLPQTALEQTLLYSLVNFKIADINLYISSPGILMFLMATRPTRGDGEKKKNWAPVPVPAIWDRHKKTSSPWSILRRSRATGHSLPPCGKGHSSGRWKNPPWNQSKYGETIHLLINKNASVPGSHKTQHQGIWKSEFCPNQRLAKLRKHDPLFTELLGVWQLPFWVTPRSLKAALNSSRMGSKNGDIPFEFHAL